MKLSDLIGKKVIVYQDVYEMQHPEGTATIKAIEKVNNQFPFLIECMVQFDGDDRSFVYRTININNIIKTCPQCGKKGKST